MRSPSRLRTIVLLLLTFAGGSFAGEPVVDYLETPGVLRGRRSSLAVVGKNVARPIGVWTTLPVGKMTFVSQTPSESNRAEIAVDVAADCPLGLYGLRVATADGLSNCVLFVVDDLEAKGGVFREGEVDRYPLEVQAGERVSFDVIASRLGTDADPLITIYDPDGKRLVRRDNDPGLFYDCCFEQTFERAGRYSVEVRDSRFLGAANWRYLLRMGKFPAARVALPAAINPGTSIELKFPELPGAKLSYQSPATQSGGFYFDFRRPEDTASAWVPLFATKDPVVVEAEPNNAFDTATLLPGVPSVAEGNLEQPGDRDYFHLELKKGDKLWLRATTKQLQSAADIELTMLDPTGKEVQRADDTPLPGGALDEASLTFNAGADGKYGFMVREMTGASGRELTYRVEVQRSIPRIQVSTDVAAVTLPSGSYQSLPVSVIRTDYSGLIELALVNAPPGVTLEPAVIPANENLLLCRLSAAGEATPGIHTLGMIAKGLAGEQAIESTVAFQPLIDKQHVNQDLQKTSLRENQRWLPPSVRHALALQLTPAIPYQVEPQDSLVVLPRYDQVALRINTPRTTGFAGEISFSASGGQLGEESQGRRQVFSRFPLGREDALTATFHSRSQANEAKERIDIVSQTQVGERSVTLMRSIMLQVKPAFELELMPALAMLQPGEQTTIKIVPKRLPSFAEPITVKPTTNAPLVLPETLIIPADAESIELQVTVPADYKPRREKIRFTATGYVNGFQEEPRAVEFDLDVKAPPPPAAPK